MELLIFGATVLTMDAELRMIPNAYVGIDGGKIVSLGQSAPTDKPNTVIDATGMVLMPGLIDCHTHLTDAVLRCYADELPWLERLETKLLPLRSRMDSRTARAAATLSIAEALRCGVTSVSCLEDFPTEAAEAAAEAGIKANIAPAAQYFEEDFDFDCSEQGQLLQRLHETWHNHDDGRIQIEAGILGEYATTDRLWERFGEYAHSFGLGVQLHLAQTADEQESCLNKYGLTPAQLLDCHGLLRGRVTAAGCAALDADDRALLHRRGASTVWLPVSAARQGLPAMDPLALIQAGVNVALGSDGAAYSGTTDLFRQMQTASVLHSATGQTLPPAALLTMATVCGAKAQGRERTCGQIRPGMDADLILLNFTAPQLIPCHNLLSQLVHCVTGQDVAMTIVRGKILYSGGTFHTLDTAHAVQELTEYGIPTMFTP